MWVQALGWQDSLEKERATHSSILAWRISWTEEPGGLQSKGSQSQTRPTLSHFFPNKVSFRMLNSGFRTQFNSPQSEYYFQFSILGG